MDFSTTALLLIDWQQAFQDSSFWGPRCNAHAEINAERLIAAWRNAGGRIFHVHHLSTEPGSPLKKGTPGTEPMAFAQVAAGEPLFTKSVNSGFIGTNLEQALGESGVENLVVCGVSTDHCVSTTTRMAANLGFDVHLVGDACFTFDRQTSGGSVIPADAVQEVHLASLHQEFANVVETEFMLAAISA